VNIKLLQRLFIEPISFLQRVSLKYGYKYLPNFLCLRPLRGYGTSQEYESFYESIKEEFNYVVPVSIPLSYMKQRPQHLALEMSCYYRVLYYTGALFYNPDNIKKVHKKDDQFYLINDGINGNTIFSLKKKFYTFFGQ
jgi:hypothetical protein